MSGRSERTPHRLFGREPVAVLRDSLCLGCGLEIVPERTFESTTGKDNGVIQIRVRTELRSPPIIGLRV